MSSSPAFATWLGYVLQSKIEAGVGAGGLGIQLTQ